MTKDQKRLAWISTIMDGIGEGPDFHEEAAKAHQKRCGCRSGPTDQDYCTAVRAAIDRARQPQTQTKSLPEDGR